MIIIYRNENRNQIFWVTFDIDGERSRFTSGLVYDLNLVDACVFFTDAFEAEVCVRYIRRDCSQAGHRGLVEVPRYCSVRNGRKVDVKDETCAGTDWLRRVVARVILENWKLCRRGTELTLSLLDRFGTCVFLLKPIIHRFFCDAKMAWRTISTWLARGCGGLPANC